MTIKVSGVELLLQPTKHRWVPQKDLDTDGDNRPTYPRVREYELAWQLMSTAEFQQVYDIWRATTTGTVVTELPQLGATDYQYYPYSGTTWEQPETDPYFEGYITNVKVIVRNVRA
jgi:hypothetical protein